jgi:hypothetical protein
MKENKPEDSQSLRREPSADVVPMQPPPRLTPDDARNLLSLLNSKRVTFTGDEVPTMFEIMNRLVAIANSGRQPP